MRLQIALAQVASGFDVTHNLTVIEHNTRRAAARGARVVVFPEAMMHRFGRPLASIAQPLDGPWANSVRAIAARHNVTVIAGMFTPAADGRIHNTLLITGAVETSYDKIHLYDAFGYRESDEIAPGSTPVTRQPALMASPGKGRISHRCERQYGAGQSDRRSGAPYPAARPARRRRRGLRWREAAYCVLGIQRYAGCGEQRTCAPAYRTPRSGRRP